jgi:hypothetical protein
VLEEEWRPVVGYKGIYEISSHGRVRSLTREVSYSRGEAILKQIVKGVVLRQKTTWRGYLEVKLSSGGRCKTYKTHRLVAETFVPNLEDKPVVNHKDGDKQNNFPDNLEWMTHSENLQHAYDTGLKDQPKGKLSACCGRGIEAVDGDGQVVAVMYGRSELVAANYCPRRIYDILAGKGKTHRGHTFRKVA